MKDLKTTIYEKLSIDDMVELSSFPIEENRSNIITFLKGIGFKEIKYSIKVKSAADMLTEMNRKKGKYFCYDDYDDDLYIANTSKEKISESNMIYLIRDIAYGALLRGYRSYYQEPSKGIKYHNLRIEEFREKISNIL